MALRFNGNSPTGPNPWSAAVGRTIGTVSGINAYTGARALSAMGGSRMAIHLTYGTAVGLPLGSTHPVSWALPSVAGVIASRNNINGAGGITGAVQSGQNIAATLTGSGGVSSGILGLIVSIAATISGSGGVSAAATQALATLTATLAGTGNITATAAGLAALSATLTGAGTVTANNTALMDITANIVGYGEATSQGIRDAVWSAVASEFNVAGTMGNKLNAAGSGGVDLTALATAVWQRVLESGYTAEELMRLLTAVAAGKTDIDTSGPNPIVTFRDLGDTKDRVTATMTGSERTTVSKDLT